MTASQAGYRKYPPEGGTSGQVLGKLSNDDWDMGWIDGGTSSGLPPVGMMFWSEESQEEQYSMLTQVGPQGAPGNVGVRGQDGATILPDSPDEPDLFLVPGPAGVTGAQGNTGATGLTGGVIFVEPEVPDEPLMIPGRDGATGAAGSNGSPGATGAAGQSIFGMDGEQGEDGWTIPGPTGATGATGPAGSSSGGTVMLVQEDYSEDNGLLGNFPNLIPTTSMDIQRYAPGSFVIPTGCFAIMHKELILTGAQTVSILGTGALRIT